MDVTNGGTNNAGADGAGSIPKGLEKFAGPDGKIDSAKLGQSYLEAEKKATVESQRASELEKAYVSMITGGGAGAGADAGSGDDDLAGAGGDNADAGREAAHKKASPASTGAGGQEIVQQFLAMSHPEIAIDPATNDFKDKEFISGLKTFVAGLPMPVKQSIARGEFASTDWAIRQFKALRGSGATSRASAGSGTGAGAGSRPNFMESTSASGTGEGKIWTKAEIRDLYVNNPKEYAKKEADISLAYEEGRVR